MSKVCNCVWNVSEQISIFCKPKMQVVFLVLATFWKNLNELKGFCWSASFLGTQKQNKGDWCVTYFVLFLCSASSKTVSFYNKDERGEIQRVTFDNDQVKRIFHGSFHKVRSLLYELD